MINLTSKSLKYSFGNYGSHILFYFDAGKEREQVGDGEVAKVSLQLLSRVSNVMYYQFECQNFLTQESLYPPPRKKKGKEKDLQ